MRSRSSKGPVIVLAVALVIVLRGAVRQRRLIRALLAFAFAYPGEGAVDAVGGFFSSVDDAIKDFVKRTVQAALSFVWDMFKSVGDWFGRIFELIGQVIDFAKSLVSEVYRWATSFIGWIYQQAINFAVSAVQYAVEFISGVIRGVVDGVMWVIGGIREGLLYVIDNAVSFVLQVVAGIRDGVMWVIDQVVAGLEWAIGNAIDFVRGWVSDIFWWLHDRLFEALDYVRDSLLSQLADLAAYVWGDVQTILDVVLAVLDWLIWLAGLPFTTARDIWDAWNDTSHRSVVDGIKAATDRQKAPTFDKIKAGLA